MATSDRAPMQPQRANINDPTASTTGATGVTGKLRDTASRVTDTVQDAAAPLIDQAGERAGQVTDQIMDQASSRLDMGKEYAVEALTGVAKAMRQTGQHLREEGEQPMFGEYADTGAEQLERFTGYLRRRDANQLLSEVESYARRHPTVFASGAFAVGLLAARFFRSSGRRAGSGSMATAAPVGRFAPLTPTAAPLATPAMPRPSVGTPQATKPTTGQVPPPRGTGSPSVGTGSPSGGTGSPSGRPGGSNGGVRTDAPGGLTSGQPRNTFSPPGPPLSDTSRPGAPAVPPLTPPS